MKILWRISYHVLSYASLWLWRLFVVGLILLAALVSAGREMAPLLRENKAWLESRLTALTGYTVQMEKVEANWEGLAPEIRANHITIGNDIEVDAAHVRVDLLRSAWQRSLVFNALEIRGARLDVFVDEADPDSRLDVRAVQQFLFSSDHIRLRDISLRLLRRSGDELPLQVISLEANNGAGHHALESRIVLAEAEAPLQLSVHFAGDAADPLAGRGQAYLHNGEGVQAERALAFFLRGLESPLLAIDRSSRVRGELWLDWNDGRLDWTAEAELRRLGVPSLGERVGYRGKLAGSFVRGESGLADLGGPLRHVFSMRVPAGEFLWGQKVLLVPDWGLRYEPAREDLGDEAALSLQVPRLELGSLKAYRELVMSRDLQKMLATLNPQGVLEHVALTVPLQAQSRFEPMFRANLRSVSVSAWEGVPALSGVSGYLESTPSSGFVEADCRDGFAMHFPDLYSRPMRYLQMRGRVQWRVETDHRVIVGGEQLQLQGEEGEGRASFRVDVPPTGDSRVSELYLSVGLRDTLVAYRNKYLPNTLPAPVQDWLKTSVRAGVAVENGFIYRGALAAGGAQEYTFQYYARLRNGQLKFDPAWPLLTDLDASLLVDNGDVNAEVTRAMLSGLRVGKTSVQVKSGELLNLQGEASGEGSAFLRLTRETPLRDILGRAFDGWKLGGSLSAHFSLGIPLASGVAGEFQEIVLHFRNNSLQMEKIHLPLESVRGDVFYSSTLGVSAAPLRATLWQRPQDITITPVVDNDGLPDMLVTTGGEVEARRIAEWTGLPFVRFLQGVVAVQGRLEIPLDASPVADDGSLMRIGLFSNLEGVQVDLPAPFYKAREHALPLAINLDVLEDRQRYQVVYGALASGRIEVMDAVDSSSVSGEVWVQQEPDSAQVSSKGLVIHANLEQAALDDWLQVVDRYSQWDKQLSKGRAQARANAATTAPQFDIRLGNFRIGDIDAGETELQITQMVDDVGTGAWQARFHHAAADGDYRLFDDTARLPLLTLDRLDLDAWHAQQAPTATESEAGPGEPRDPLGEVVPQELPALRFHARQVIHEGNHLGEWKFDVHPQPWGAALENLSANMPGLRITGIEDNQGARLEWHRDDETSETRAISKVQLIGQEGVKSLFGVDRIIEARETTLHGQLRWEGSPAHLQFNNLRGEVSFRSVNGRFLNSNTSTDFMRVINVFNFNTWARRLRLDFSDLYKSGVSYDKMSGHVQLDRGVMVVDKPLVMESPSSRFTMQGKIDNIQNVVEADLEVTLPVSDNAAWVTALAGGLPAAVGVWAVSKIFQKQIDNLSTVSYTVSGTLDAPEIRFKRLVKIPGGEPPPVTEPANSQPVPMR